MHQFSSHFVLGFHGCDKEIGKSILSDKSKFKASDNDYDWLGHGIYFWEADPVRGLQFAKEKKKRNPQKIKKPYVIGAILDLRYCLDLTTQMGLNEVREAHFQLQIDYLLALFDDNIVKPFPENDAKKKLHYLDCAVINSVHKFREKNDLKPFDTVKGIFQEGKTLYPESAFMAQTHTQICVRNLDCIIGTFKIEQPE